ncbi:PDR/VanB family oxidoreductase [Fodinicola acaciae]|uniref:PDR/VanB family oxidoreductase n=1 Tax=Fodinicola acaciae TaxID=2681555 RepID=UPI0013D68EBB|nr:PDR/VanB family oxidoreductase [Fodinicola acaciae]
MPPDRMLSVVTAVGDRYTRALRFFRSSRPDPGAGPADLRLRIAERRVEADEVVSLRLVRPDGGPLPAWQPGCHLDVTLPSSRRRQYSLCGDPADRRAYRIAVRRLSTGGGGSREIHRLTAGETVTVRGPRNAFPFVAEGPLLLIAGGIGITPVLPMAREGARRGLDWRLVYTGRTRASMSFLGELERLGDRAFIRPDDEYGVPSVDDLLAGAAAGGSVYCCGPAPMLALVRAGFRATGARSLHFERFSPPPVVDGRPLDVELRRSGGVLRVPADRSVLSVVRDARPNVAYSCQQGFCGTCRARVLPGSDPVDHRDRRLTDAQRAAGDMLICVSRVHGDRLVLDL